MVSDFEALHRQLADLARFAVKQRREESVTSLGDAIERDEKRLTLSFLPERQRVDSPYTAARYVAWEIGKAAIALGGFSVLGNAIDWIEQNAGEEEAEWLSRRWVGLTGSSGEVWSD